MSDPGLKFILACAGPLSNDMESIETFTKAILDTHPARLDSTAIDVPWRQAPNLSERKLRLGVLPEDPSYPLHPPIKIAVSQAVSRLRAAGLTLVELTAEECKVGELNEIAWGLFGLDNTANRMVIYAGEPHIPSRDRIASEFKRVEKTHLPDLTTLSALEKLSFLTIKKAAAVENWRKVWESHGLDAVIGPSAQNTAVKHDDFGMPPYTCFLNVLNYPACVIPFESAKLVSGTEFQIQTGQAGPPCEFSLEGPS
ncbi:hypothetical protein ACHAPJ_005301 [Fusarium lateritium]